MERFELLSAYLNKNDVVLSAKQEEQLYFYYKLLADANKKLNLTAIDDIKGVEEKHFLDSLAIVAFVDIGNITSFIDIGSGAGFPGIPLKIIFPKTRAVLVDSRGKRVNFLNIIIDKLKLSETVALNGRAEELAHDPAYREGFDLCVSRAVGKLSSLSELCLPFVKEGGLFLPYKSGNVDEELKQAQGALRKLGGRLEKTVDMVIGPSELRRSFPIIRKIEKTRAIYPRRNGVPQKTPLT